MNKNISTSLPPDIPEIPTAQSKPRSKRVWPIVTAIFILMALLGFSIALQRNTLTEWWKPAGACLLLALPTGWLLAGICKKLSGFSNRLVNAGIGVAFSFVTLLAIFYGVNFFGSDSSTHMEKEAEVINKYTEQRYHSRRAGRRYVRGDKYYVYGVTLRLENGFVKKVEIPVGEYVRIRTGAKVNVEMERGFFGVPVVKNVGKGYGITRRH